MQEHSLPPPTRPDAPLPEHMPDYVPFGQDAVASEEQRLDREIAADYYGRAAEFTAQYAGVPDPRFYPVKQLARRVLGKTVAGPEVAEWLTENQAMNLADLPGQYTNMQSSYEASSGRHNVDLNTWLHAARSRLAELDEYQKDDFLQYFASKAPDSMKALYDNWVMARGKDQSGDVLTWLTEEPSVDAASPNNQLLNFLQWHNHRTEHINSNPEIQQRVHQHKEAFKSNITSAVEEGHLPQSVLQSFEKVDQADVIVGDVFDTIMAGRHGYFNRNQAHQIVLQEGYETAVFDHEMIHAAVGRFDNVLLDEAVTEHLARTLNQGHFDIVDPYRRAGMGYGGLYKERRAVLTAWMNDGEQPIDLLTVCEAFIEADKNGPANKKFQDMSRKAHGGVDVEDFISYEMTEKLARLKEGSISLSKKEEYDLAARYAASSIAVLHKMLVGETVDALLADEVEKVLQLEGIGGETKTKWINALVVNRTSQQAEIEEYLHIHKTREIEKAAR